MSAKNPANRRTPHFSRREAFRLAAGAATGTLLTSRGSNLSAQTSAAPLEIVIPDTGAALPTENVTFRWIDSGEVARAYVEAYFPKYREAHPNITVDYQSLPNPDLDQVIPLSVQGGSAPDVFRMPPGTTGAQAVRNGWVAPLD